MAFPPQVYLTQKAVRTVKLTKEYALGTRGMTTDGRVYRYALAGEALSIGIPLNSAAQGGLCAAGLSAIVNDTEDLTSTSSQIVLSTTNSTWTAVANEYTDGFLVVEASTHTDAAGQMVRIKSNTAGSTSTTNSPYSTTVVFDAESRLEKGLDTGPTVQCVYNPYFDVIEMDGGSTMLPLVGVPNCTVVDNGYFWAQTWGVCPVLNDGTVVLGNLVVGSTGTDQGLQAITTITTTTDTAASGLVPLFKAASRPAAGWAYGPASGDNDYSLIFLTISP